MIKDVDKEFLDFFKKWKKYEKKIRKANLLNPTLIVVEYGDIEEYDKDFAEKIKESSDVYLVVRNSSLPWLCDDKFLLLIKMPKPETIQEQIDGNLPQNLRDKEILFREVMLKIQPCTLNELIEKIGDAIPEDDIRKIFTQLRNMAMIFEDETGKFILVS